MLFPWLSVFLSQTDDMSARFFVQLQCQQIARLRLSEQLSEGAEAVVAFDKTLYAPLGPFY